MRKPQVADFIRKIKLTAVKDVEFEKARMTVTLKDGRKLTETVTKVKGDPQHNPMTRDDILAKFWTNVDFSGKISKKKATELLRRMENLEKQGRLRTLIPLLVA